MANGIDPIQQGIFNQNPQATPQATGGTQAQDMILQSNPTTVPEVAQEIDQNALAIKALTMGYNELLARVEALEEAGTPPPATPTAPATPPTPMGA